MHVWTEGGGKWEEGNDDVLLLFAAIFLWLFLAHLLVLTFSSSRYEFPFGGRLLLNLSPSPC